jgi:protein-S-isoprenylcysteine O-methyltransferase Ste14
MKLRQRTAGSTYQGDSPESTGTMIPARSRRSRIESVFMRVIATAGIVALGVAVAAILADNDVQGWIIGLAVSTVSVVLAAVLWSARYV